MGLAERTAIGVADWDSGARRSPVFRRREVPPPRPDLLGRGRPWSGCWRRVAGGRAARPRGFRKSCSASPDPSGLKPAVLIDSQEHAGARFSAVVGHPLRGAIAWAQADPGRGAGGGQARGLPNKLFGEPRPERTEIGVVD